MTTKPQTLLRLHWDLLLIALTYLLLFCFTFSDVLFIKALVPQKNTAAWYGAFHYFIESLVSGTLPYWNPYSHGGEPFYFSYSAFRLLDPTMLIPFLIAKFSHPDLYHLYNGYCLLKEFLYLLGVLCLIKYFFKNRFLLFSLAFLFLVFYKNELPQLLKRDAIGWFPWICLAMAHAYRTSSKVAIILSAYLMGILVGAGNSSSLYIFAFLALFTIGVSALDLPHFKAFVKNNGSTLGLSLLLFFGLSLPFWAIHWDKNLIFPVEQVFGAREYYLAKWALGEFHPGLSFDFNFMHPTYFSGHFLRPSLFVHTIFGNPHPLFGFALILTLYGIFFVQFPFKQPLLFTLLALIYLAISNTPFHRLLYEHVPLYNELKHPIGFIYFLEFFFLFFCGSALNAARTVPIQTKRVLLIRGILVYAVAFWISPALRETFFISALGMLGFLLLAPRPRIWMLYFIFIFLGVQNAPRVHSQWREGLQSRELTVSDLNDIYADLKKRDFHAAPISYDPIRQFSLPRPGWILLEPQLLKRNVALTTILEPARGKSTQSIPYMRYTKDPVFSNRALYWPAAYVEPYLMGEINLGSFFDLMGVNKNLLRFYPDSSVQFLGREALKRRFLSYPYQIRKMENGSSDGFQIENGLTEQALYLEGTATLDVPTNDAANPSPLPPLNASIHSFTSNSLHFSGQAPSSGYVLYNDNFDPHWKARLNGSEVPVTRANLAFKAVSVPQGSFQIEFDYFPNFFAYSVRVYFLLNLGIGAYLLTLSLKRANLSFRLHKPTKPLGQT